MMKGKPPVPTVPRTMLVIGEPAFSFAKKRDGGKGQPAPSAMIFPHQPETVRRSKKKSAIPISATAITSQSICEARSPRYQRR